MKNWSVSTASTGSVYGVLSSASPGTASWQATPLPKRSPSASTAVPLFEIQHVGSGGPLPHGGGGTKGSAAETGDVGARGGSI